MDDLKPPRNLRSLSPRTWAIPPGLTIAWAIVPPKKGRWGKRKGTNQSMYFLMTPERNSSFAITSHLYNYIKYKYNICIMTLYNYIYMYLYLRVYICVWLSARVHFTTSVIRKQLWKITIFNRYVLSKGKVAWLSDMTRGYRASMPGGPPMFLSRSPLERLFFTVWPC